MRMEVFVKVLRMIVIVNVQINGVVNVVKKVLQTFSFNSLCLSAPEEACSRNVRAFGTLNMGIKVFLTLYLVYSS